MNDVAYATLFAYAQMISKEKSASLYSPPIECGIHKKEFTIFCKDCQLTLCEDCFNEEHKEHQTIALKGEMQ